MEPYQISLANLREFIHHHKLMDRFSNIQFEGLITIQTAQNQITSERMRVMINLNDYKCYASITIMESHIDPNLYPTVLCARFQKIEHVNKEYLYISDTHTLNHNIGKYSVKITPLSKLEN